MSEAPFFIGWTGPAPGAERRFLGVVGAAMLGALALAGLGLGALADDTADTSFATVPGAAVMDLPEGATLTGVLTLDPYPVMHLANGRSVLMSGDGKVGSPTTAALAGQTVTAEGFVLKRGTIAMLVSGEGPRALGPGTPPVAEALGRWRLTGEVCDGKCAGGAMKPGIGIAHRACATLCITGEVPAIFVATAPVAGQSFLLLAGGVERFRDVIGRRVTLEGDVERLGDLLVFRP